MTYKIKLWKKASAPTSELKGTYKKLGEKGRAACDARFDYLVDQPPSGWVDPQAKKLSWERDKDCHGIYEVRFKANGVQQRPMGYFGPGTDEFTILLWATHKDKQYRPSNYCELAQRRIKEINNGTATASEDLYADEEGNADDSEAY